MREIKFRAWNKNKHIMCYDDEDSSSEYLDGINMSHIGFINRSLQLIPEEYYFELGSGEMVYYGPSIRDDYELMQFTGLHDKCGNEIYEGDITTNELYKSEGLAFMVYYDNEKGMFKQRPFIFENNGKKLGNKDLTLQMDSVTNKEIIGNIYEDTELLEVKGSE